MSIPALSYRHSGGPGLRVDLDALIRTRMLIQANSGGGKSWALRQLLEETFGRVQHIVIDPEGEYHTLREQFDYVLAARHGADVEASPRTAKMLCRRLMETSASAVIDLYDLNIAQRREFVKLFLTELMALPKDLRRPLLVVLDEAHVFAPEGAKSDALEAVMSLASQGRKRGYALICATQRLSKLSKDVAAEMLTRLIGRTGLDLDVKRAGDELGMDKEGRQKLPVLDPGQFYAFGPALPPGPPRLVRSGSVKTSHPQPGALEAPTPPPSAKVRALLERSLADLPTQAAEEARNLGELQKEVSRLKGELTRADRSSRAAAPDPAALQRAIDAAVRSEREGVERLRRSLARDLKSVQSSIAAAGVAALKVPDLISGSAAALTAVLARMEMFTPGSAPATPIASPRSPEAAHRPRPQQVARATRVDTGEVTKPQQRLLDALAELEVLGVDGPSRHQLGMVAGYNLTGGSGAQHVADLAGLGFVEVGGGTVRLTDDGRAIAQTDAVPRSLEELHERVLVKLSAGQRKIAEHLISIYPEPITRAELGETTGYNLTGGSGAQHVADLVTVGAAVIPSAGKVAASKLLFPEGL